MYLMLNYNNECKKKLTKNPEYFFTAIKLNLINDPQPLLPLDQQVKVMNRRPETGRRHAWSFFQSLFHKDFRTSLSFQNP